MCSCSLGNAALLTPRLVARHVLALCPPAFSHLALTIFGTRPLLAPLIFERFSQHFWSIIAGISCTILIFIPSLYYFTFFFPRTTNPQSLLRTSFLTSCCFRYAEFKMHRFHGTATR